MSAPKFTEPVLHQPRKIKPAPAPELPVDHPPVDPPAPASSSHPTASPEASFSASSFAVPQASSLDPAPDAELPRPHVPALDIADPFASVRTRAKTTYSSLATKQSPAAAKTAAKKARWIELVGEGFATAEIAAQVGTSPQGYEYWRRTDERFKADVDVARARLQRSGKTDTAWTGDFASFRETFFPRDMASPAFHYDIIRKIESAPPQSITLINVFPNAGKSALIEDWICYKLAVDPDHRIAVISKGTDQARKMLGFVQNRMTDHYTYPGYVARFGPFYDKGQEREGKPWTRDYLRVFKASPEERDPSLQVKGWTSQILGSRLDTIILDDVQDGENLSAVEKMLDKFRREYFSRIKGGRIIIIGNRIANGDLYERLVDEEIVTPGQHFDFPAIGADGESLWPERWPTTTTYDSNKRVTGTVGLDHMRKIVGEAVWWTTYQQRPSLSTNATFDDGMIEAAKNWGLKVGAFTPGAPMVLTIDPGLDPGITSILAASYSTDSITVVDTEIHNNFTRQEDILDLIESYAIRYHPQHVVIETVAYQRALARDERLEAMGRQYGFQVIGHNTNRNKIDTVMGVAAMASSFLRNEIQIPWEGAISPARMEGLVTELRAWRPGVPDKLLKQDRVMTLWFAWHFILQQRHVMGVTADTWQRRGLAWKPTYTPRILRSVS